MQSPNLDDVKVNVTKMSAGGLRPDQAVISNSFTLNQASGLIGFAVPDMKNAFFTYRRGDVLYNVRGAGEFPHNHKIDILYG